MDREKRKKVQDRARQDAKSGDYGTTADDAAAQRGGSQVYKDAFNEERLKIRKAKRRREEGN